ncbi:MAG TPA: peptidylprolyl isomerase [Candidatus Angelobacter sp.]|jgi:peptidyl-prolyl cis-trans isomerase SurA|nr:peptidylprolyl isomerase [Candidatus Angelobacter sp.]
MKKSVLLLLPVLLCVPYLLGQQSQSALPAGTVAPAASTPAPAPASDGTVVEEIIVRINSSIISLSDLKKSEEQLANEMAHPDPNAGADAAPKQQDLLRDLIDSKLLAQKAEELGISADTDVIKRLDELRKQMHADSMEDLEKAAQGQGVSFEEFKQNMKEQILTQKVVQQEVGAHLNVTQQEMQDYYAQHKTEMERPETVRLSEILVSTQTPAAAPAAAKVGLAVPAASDDELVAQAKVKADSIYAQLQKGAKFADVAQKNSNGPTAAQGGDLEYFKRGTLSKQLEDQVFGLKAGQYTEPIRTNQGWVILEVTEHIPEGIPPFKDVENAIQERLYMSKMQPALREYLTKLREDAYIDIKAGYIDSGASPNETKPVFTTAAAADSTKPKKKKKYGIF